MVSKDKWKEKWFSNGNSYVPPLPGVPLLELADAHRIMIENHGGVSAYSDSRICVRVCMGQYTVNGKNLTLTYMSRCQLVITGEINSIIIERG